MNISINLNDYYLVNGTEATIYIPKEKLDWPVYKLYKNKVDEYRNLESQKKWLDKNPDIKNKYNCEFLKYNESQWILRMDYVSTDLFNVIQHCYENPYTTHLLSLNSCIFYLTDLANKFIRNKIFITDLMVENIMLGEDGFVILDGGGAIGENETVSINNCKAAVKNRYLVENSKEAIKPEYLCAVQIIRIFAELIHIIPGMSWILFGLVDSVDIGYDFSKLIKNNLPYKDSYFEYECLLKLNDSGQEDAKEIIRDLILSIKKYERYDIMNIPKDLVEQEIILISILDLFYDLNRLESPISLEKMVEKLSRLYKYSLNNSDESIVSSFKLNREEYRLWYNMMKDIKGF